MGVGGVIGEVIDEGRANFGGWPIVICSYDLQAIFAFV